MRYSGIIYNDIAAAPGLSLTFFTQGCPHRCKGCHNPETWDFNGGKEFTQETLNTIIEKINDRNILRNFCLMGGEPLCSENLFLSYSIILELKKHYPNIKIYIWTGYSYNELLKNPDEKIKKILNMSDYLIDGLYKEELRDITLELRGSSNQNIINLKNN